MVRHVFVLLILWLSTVFVTNVQSEHLTIDSNKLVIPFAKETKFSMDLLVFALKDL